MLLLLVYFFALIGNQNALLEANWPPVLGLWIVHLAFLAIGVGLLVNVGKPVKA